MSDFLSFAADPSQADKLNPQAYTLQPTDHIPKSSKTQNFLADKYATVYNYTLYLQTTQPCTKVATLMVQKKYRIHALKSRLRRYRKGFHRWLHTHFNCKHKDSTPGFIYWSFSRYIPTFFCKYPSTLVRRIIRNYQKSWETSKPEYPMYILMLLLGLILGGIYYWLFADTFKDSNSFLTGMLTVTVAPLILVMWKWRNTHRLTEFKIQQRTANEALLVKAGEQLGSSNEVVRLSGIEATDRYARLMIEDEEPDYGEFQRAVSMLCVFARQRCQEKKCERDKAKADKAPRDTAEAAATTETQTETTNTAQKQTPTEKTTKAQEPTIPTEEPIWDTDYRHCIDRIFRLMRDYYTELMGCCEFKDNNVNSTVLSFPVVNLKKCNLQKFEFHERYFMVKADLTRCDLRKCKFSGIEINYAKLRNADLRKASLKWAILIGVDLWNTNLIGAHLSHTFFIRTTLSRVNFKNANLRSASLPKAVLYDADLREANLKMANLSYADLWNADLREANLWHADLSDADLNKYTKISLEQLQSAKSIEGLHSKLDPNYYTKTKPQEINSDTTKTDSDK